MDKHTFSTYKVEDRSYLAFIKREIHQALAADGYGSKRMGEIDIIVSELTSNLIKHADGGEVLYKLGGVGDQRYFEIFAVDHGVGAIDIQRMMKDGLSSSNTLGHGLGAINRLSDIFQIYSQKGWGTVAYSKSFIKPPVPVFPRPKENLHCAVLQVCMPGEVLCGDGWQVKKNGNETQIFVGDGLGHGPHAHEAVQLAIQAFKECKLKEPADILRYIHTCVKKTRGLVATIAILNHTTNEWKICGIGNITTRLFEGLESKNYMSHNGILGHNIPNTMNNYVAKEEKYQCIIMYSDGMRTRWDLLKYPSILRYDPAIIAATIFKDNARRTDDMTVFVGKINF